MRRLTLELHFLVARYGGLRLPFRGITGYLHGLVSVNERPIIAGGRVWMAYSTELQLRAELIRATYRLIRYSCTYTAHMSPSLNGSSALLTR